MDCIDLFKKAAVALQTDARYLESWTRRAARTIWTKNCRT